MVSPDAFGIGYNSFYLFTVGVRGNRHPNVVNVVCARSSQKLSAPTTCTPTDNYGIPPYADDKAQSSRAPCHIFSGDANIIIMFDSLCSTHAANFKLSIRARPKRNQHLHFHSMIISTFEFLCDFLSHFADDSDSSALVYSLPARNIDYYSSFGGFAVRRWRQFYFLFVIILPLANSRGTKQPGPRDDWKMEIAICKGDRLVH